MTDATKQPVFHPDMLILDVMLQGDAVVAAFREMELACPDCVVSEVETLRDAARLYERDLEELVSELARRSGGRVVDTVPEVEDPS